MSNTVSEQDQSGQIQLARPLVVLMSTAGPDGTTKFVDQIVREASDAVRFKYFSWRTALFGRFDVFHVHWPEALIRGRNKWVAGGRTAAMLVFLLRLRMSRVKVLRTLHNVDPHQKGSRLENAVVDRLVAATDLVVTLNAATPVPRGPASELILHGDYVEAFEHLPRGERVAGRILYFGRIQRYKGIDVLIDAFKGLPGDRASLRLIGNPDAAIAREIRDEMHRNPKVTADLRFVPDQELVEEISSAQVAVLPYREMHNSGALLVALSLRLPTLAPATPTNALIQEEVGAEWLRLYSEVLETSDLEDALAWSEQPRSHSPVFHPERKWRQVASSYERAYRRVVGRDR